LHGKKRKKKRSTKWLGVHEDSEKEGRKKKEGYRQSHLSWHRPQKKKKEDLVVLEREEKKKKDFAFIDCSQQRGSERGKNKKKGGDKILCCYRGGREEKNSLSRLKKKGRVPGKSIGIMKREGGRGDWVFHFSAFSKSRERKKRGRHRVGSRREEGKVWFLNSDRWEKRGARRSAMEFRKKRKTREEVTTSSISTS